MHVDCVHGVVSSPHLWPWLWLLLLLPQGLARKYMSAPVTVDLIESQSAQASTDVAHYMLMVRPVEGVAPVCG